MIAMEHTHDMDALIARSQAVLLRNYARQPLAFTHGDGARLWDVAGREYIDFCGGIAVSSLGHGDTAVSRAVAAQAGRLLHVSNLYEIPEQVALAEALRDFLGYERFFFCNSGTEANEALIKLLRAWGKSRGKHRIIVARNGFHGRSLGALSATAQPAMQEAFGPLLEGFDAVDFGELQSIEQRIGPETAAILVEPIQAEGGGNFPPPAYLAELRRLCDAHDMLLALDEVQLGMGRSGTPLAQDRFGVKADAVALAKGLGGGFPIGALALRESLLDVLGPGSHGSTFGGNPLACVAGLAVVGVLAMPGALDHVQRQGQRLLAALDALAASAVTRPRGLGLFVCFNTPDSGALIRACREAGLLVAGAKHNTVRLLPPLTLSDDELDEGLRRLRDALTRLD